jgi:hypothetical protein
MRFGDPLGLDFSICEHIGYFCRCYRDYFRKDYVRPAQETVDRAVQYLKTKAKEIGKAAQDKLNGGLNEIGNLAKEWILSKEASHNLSDQWRWEKRLDVPKMSDVKVALSGGYKASISQKTKNARITGVLTGSIRFKIPIPYTLDLTTVTGGGSASFHFGLAHNPNKNTTFATALFEVTPFVGLRGQIDIVEDWLEAFVEVGAFGKTKLIDIPPSGTPSSAGVYVRAVANIFFMEKGTCEKGEQINRYEYKYAWDLTSGQMVAPPVID